MRHSNGALTSPNNCLTTGVADYYDFRPGLQEPLPRIYVPFSLDGIATWHLALLDTGGHFLILSPEVAETISNLLVEGSGRTNLNTAHGRISGELYRYGIKLVARYGEDLGVDATVLVSPDWHGPNLIGYTGVLDRIRFAVDPKSNQFFFGPVT